jgi:hypothetical protein
VLESLPVLMKKSEMEEVYNKLRALNKAWCCGKNIK